MIKFSFRTDDKSHEFCESIAKKMADRYRIPLDEAVSRINELWCGNDIIGDDVVYHDEEDYWVDHIFRFKP
jgi:hypothetical protein